MATGAPPARWRKHATASELGALSVCEFAVLLERSGHGEPADAPHRLDGQRVHAQFEKAAAAHHDAGRAAPPEHRNAPSSPDAPAKPPSSCFIATAVYGEDARETDELRRFRDRVLLRHRAFAWTVPLYYRVSPPLARSLRRHPRARSVVRLALDSLRRVLPAAFTRPIDPA